ncbi:MAG: cytidylyltransferase domain-containing protein [Nonlabens sp.]|uniref:acylneuraminate cytidylyltransferase family protein n=1 Tax=Nonlabens sp. TaxID=1888209 RepID=UPI003EF5C8AA
MKSVIIIPARGGSKRLPGKNLKLLEGKPLIDYSIEYALENRGLVDEIVVSSDDEAILSHAQSMGVNIHVRNSDLATDFATTASVLKNVVEESAFNYDNVILLQPTNPFRPAQLLDDSLELFNNSNASSFFTVSTLHDKLGTITDDNFKPANYKFGERSQDLNPLYYENGLLYITKSESILKGEIMTEDNIVQVIDHLVAQVDIDTLVDFEFAAFVHKKWIK